LTDLIKNKAKITKCAKYNSYTNKRKEAQDVSKSVANFIKSNYEIDKKAIYTWMDFNTVLIKRWKAHSQGLIKIKILGEGN
jgi:hypothetical protein